MNKKITKRQHVVPKKYLSNWENQNQQIYWYKKNSNKKEIKLTNPINLSVYNFFYKINSISIDERELLLSFINEEARKTFISCKIDEKNLIKSLLLFYELDQETYSTYLYSLVDSIIYLSSIKNILESNSIYEYILRTKSYEDFYNEGIESIQSCYEHLGYTFLNKVYNKDFENLEKDIPSFILYITVQYFRTNSLKQHAKDAIPKIAAHIDNIWTILQILMATNLSINLLTNSLLVTIIHNETTIPFITGDQPVINTKADLLNEDTKDLEFFHPINPYLALKIIDFESENIEYRIEHRNIDIKNIEKMNLLIKENSDFIYSNDEKVLETLI